MHTDTTRNNVLPTLLWKDIIHKRIQSILVICIIVAALWLRFYNLSDTIGFRGDQAKDLSIARNLVENGSWPLLGPKISVDQFNVPPTYYYILALFYSVFRTPQGVTLTFAVMNLCALYFMVRLTSLLIDKNAGVIMALLFSVSSVMVAESRQMWQLHPLAFLTTASLLFLLLASKRKSVTMLIISVLFYVCALSVYPSPILLLPYFIVSLSTFFKNRYGYKTVPAVFVTTGLMILAGIPFFGPYSYYEWTHGFPTWQALHTSAFSIPPVWSVIKGVFVYVTGFVGGVFGIGDGTEPMDIKIIEIGIFTTFIFLSLSVRRKKYPVKEVVRTEKFLMLPWLLLGACLILLFRGIPFAYRLYVFFPFFLIQFTLLIRTAFFTNSRVFTFAVVILLLAYILLNTQSIYSKLIRYPRNDIVTASSAASYVARDMAKKNLQIDSVAVYVYMNDKKNDYYLFPVLYYLSEKAHFPMPIVPSRNTIDITKLQRTDVSVVYLICMRYQDIAAVGKNCTPNFQNEYPSYKQTNEQMIGKETIVMTLQKN